MPRTTDYPERFDCIRRAVCDEVIANGTRELSLPRVAARMGVSLSTIKRLLRSSDDLPKLGMQWLASRNQARTFSTPVPTFPTELEDWQRSLNQLLRQLPLDEHGRDELRAWRALVSCAPDAAWSVDAERERVERLDDAVRRLVDRLEAVASGRIDGAAGQQILHDHVRGLAGQGRAA